MPSNDDAVKDVAQSPARVAEATAPANPDHGLASAHQESGALGRALRRGESRLKEWTRDGTLVGPVHFSAAWGVAVHDVEAARERGEIFGIWIEGVHWYASEALKIDRPNLALINRSLGHTEPSGKLLFLLRTHGGLGGQTVAEAVAAGGAKDVLRLAAEWAK